MATLRLGRRLALREWAVLSALLLALASWMGWQNGLGRLDLSMYDQFLSSHGRPARDDIIIVAIDDYSLSELGRWPWSRANHVQLLERLNHAEPRAIGIDLIFSESDERGQQGGHDKALAEQMTRARRLVMPIITAERGKGMVAVTPASTLLAAKPVLGHIDLIHDADGVVRSIYLREGPANQAFPHFALAMLPPGLQSIADSKIATMEANDAKPVHEEDWQRREHLLIPYLGNNGHFRAVPYVSVLRGEVPDVFFNDKYVLVGATALGMGDAYPTPVSGQAGAMPGVEINANVLASLLDHHSIVTCPRWQSLALATLPVALAMLCYLLMAPRAALLTGFMLMVATLSLSYTFLRKGVWVPPAAGLIVLTLSYPLWSWRRLEAAIAYLGQEFMRLDHEPHVLPEPLDQNAKDGFEDVLESRISAMSRAASRVRDLRQFVSDSLNSLPDAILVTDVAGRVLLANQLAIDYFDQSAPHDLRGAILLDLLEPLQQPQPLGQAGNTAFTWRDLLDLRQTAMLSNGVSARDAQQRDLLIKSAPCFSASSLQTGWIVTLIDISTMRSAERSRDETLRFLSHDMRAPQASILALLELQQDKASALPAQEFFGRIEKASRKTLGLADNFVQLARAESQEYRLEDVDFQDMLFDAIDEMWALAHGKHIRIESQVAPGEYPVWADRALMTRALTNLLSNAINYSPEHSEVLCTLDTIEQGCNRLLRCSIRDQGQGIAPEDLNKLFHRFQRLDQARRSRQEGIGLGLVFVKTVAERHHGRIGVDSALGVGSTFTLELPLPTAGTRP